MSLASADHLLRQKKASVDWRTIVQNADPGALVPIGGGGDLAVCGQSQLHPAFRDATLAHVRRDPSLSTWHPANKSALSSVAEVAGNALLGGC